jgi:hypothetical protein
MSSVLLSVDAKYIKKGNQVSPRRFYVYTFAIGIEKKYKKNPPRIFSII